jgi:hypothetical protein
MHLSLHAPQPPIWQTLAFPYSAADGLLHSGCFRCRQNAASRSPTSNRGGRDRYARYFSSPRRSRGCFDHHTRRHHTPRLDHPLPTAAPSATVLKSSNTDFSHGFPANRHLTQRQPPRLSRQAKARQKLDETENRRAIHSPVSAFPVQALWTIRLFTQWIIPPRTFSSTKLPAAHAA